MLAQQLLKQTDLFRFPYFTTYSLDFSNAATNMLSQQCTAVMMSEPVQKEIRELVALANAKKNKNKNNAAVAATPAPATA